MPHTICYITKKNNNFAKNYRLNKVELNYYMDWQQRTILQIGLDGQNRLKNSKILLLGCGGVGASCAEFLARAGVGNITIVDGDKVNTSNINRQLCALNSTIGKLKTQVTKDRLLDINPLAKIDIISEYVKDARMQEIILSDNWDYIVDAIDTLSPKVYLLYYAIINEYKIISSMGAGGRFNPELVKVVDVADSFNCQLASAIRKKLHKLNIFTGFKVVFSPEFVDKKNLIITNDELNKKSIVGTVSYMPALFGLHCASTVIRDLLEENTVNKQA